MDDDDMIARLKVYGPDGTTARTANVGQGAGILPTIGLQFSVEVGGAGSCSFTALSDHLDALTARDSVIKVEILDGVTWTAVGVYALRPPFRRAKVGFQQVQCTGTALLPTWAGEVVIMPEYATTSMPKGAGTDRAIGWQSSFYDPATDPNEAWDGCYATARTTFPTGWPSGTGADWISVTGATDSSERKLFRATLTIPAGDAQLCRAHMLSDESAVLYVGAEPMISTSSVETGWKQYDAQENSRDMVLWPGTYAVAVDTATDFTKGGDGIDPIAVAICTLDDNGDPDTWLLVSNDADWVACRRDDEPPNNEPPGPTPGAAIDYMVGEAVDRSASGWASVTLGFTATADSYSVAWPAVVVERQVRYGSDDMWSVWNMLGETGECDVWLDPDLTLQAAPNQGVDRTGSITLGTSDIVTMNDTTPGDEGTWAVGLALDGWIDATETGASIRREYGMEIGTAISRAVADRIMASSLAENGRWDGSARLSPACAHTPLVDFGPGDRIAMSYADAPAQAQIVSISANAGESGLEWDLELAEVTG